MLVGASIKEIVMQGCENCGIAAIRAGGCFSCDRNLDQSLEQLPAVWKKRFALIERAGGPTRANILTLSAIDRFRASFNIWAFLFGTFYFLAKGMWRRAISFTLALLATSVIFDLYIAALGAAHALPNPTNFAGPAFFACMANLCYYKEKVLGDRGWW
jgi:hypothetical protein